MNDLYFLQPNFLYNAWNIYVSINQAYADCYWHSEVERLNCITAWELST